MADSRALTLYEELVTPQHRISLALTRQERLFLRKPDVLGIVAHPTRRIRR
jgi:hypothetical protein